MGSFIGIGFIYNLTYSFMDTELLKDIDYLVSMKGQIIRYKYSKDSEGMEWVEKESNALCSSQDVSKSITKNFFGSVHIKCAFLKNISLDVFVSIKTIRDDCFGILLEIPEIQLIADVDKIGEVTEKIIGFIKDIFAVSPFDYALCDTEAEIEYTLKEIKAIGKKVYSILVFPHIHGQQVSFDIQKNDWNIDGITYRQNLK